MTELNYENEMNALKEMPKTEWFKPNAGIHKVKIVEIGKDYEQDFNDDGVFRTKKLLKIEHEGKIKSWGVSKSLSLTSLYGQLIVVGKDKGRLEGQVITLFVKGEGKQKNYTIAEAMEAQEFGKQAV